MGESKSIVITICVYSKLISETKTKKQRPKELTFDGTGNRAVNEAERYDQRKRTSPKWKTRRKNTSEI